MWAGFDYGFVHPTVAILTDTRDGDGRTDAIAEHVRRRALPPHHVVDITSLVGGFGRGLDDVGPWAARLGLLLEEAVRASGMGRASPTSTQSLGSRSALPAVSSNPQTRFICCSCPRS